MAHTGMGTDACLRQGCLPLPVHYYSPVPDLEEMEQRNIWDKQSSMAGVKWNPEEQLPSPNIIRLTISLSAGASGLEESKWGSLLKIDESREVLDIFLQNGYNSAN